MCGFSGYFYFNGFEENSNSVIQEMLFLQKHRGPDDSGIVGINTKGSTIEEIEWRNTQSFNNPSDLVFGFNRLSILDLSSNGHQPMKGANDQVVLMMNGEIYNAFDFKPELIRKGYQFKSDTDTEVVLNLYLEYGIEQMLRLLNGMFALAIYDFRLGELFIARDRFGIKPIYLLWQENRLAFSSEMKSFKALPDFKFELDEKGLDEFLVFRNLINETLFKNIINITPGTYWRINNNKESKEIVYYHINDEGNSFVSNKDALNLLDQGLEKSVERQLMSDVKLGCQLSGGVDSSLVSYYAAKGIPEGQLETISIIFKEKKFSEEKFIDEAAGLLKLKTHKYLLDQDNYFKIMNDASWHFEQPVNHPNTIGIYLLSKHAREHVTVLLSGEGSDELLAGYSRFIQMQEFPYFNRNFFSKLKQNSGALVDFLSYYSDEDKRLVMGNSFGSLSTINQIRPGFSFSNAIEKRLKLLNNLSGTLNQRQRKYEILTYIPDLLMRQDKMSMASSIENRVPFLDNDLVSLGLNLRDELLVNNYHGKKEGKLLLKEICKNKFNEKFAFRDKMGFGIPLKSFMSSKEFEDRWNDEIMPFIEKRGIFNPTFAKSCFNNLSTSTPEIQEMIWLLTSFEIWAKQYLD